MTGNNAHSKADRFPQFARPDDPCNVTVDRCRVPPSSASHRILIMRLAAYGDVLMATPLLAALRAAYPESHITWIVERNQADTINANPHVDELLLWQGRYWKRLLRRFLLPVWIAQALKMRRMLRERRYDIFISLQPEEWPLLARAVNAKVSVGIFDTFRRFNSDRPTSKNTRLFTRAFTHLELPQHRTDQYLLALGALGLPVPSSKRMTLGYTSDDRTAADKFISELGLSDNERLVVVAPQTTWETRCWPESRYAAVCGSLMGKGAKVVLIGTAQDRPTLDRIRSGMQHEPAIAAGRLTFRECAAFIDRASLVISGDTGPMHAAASVGTPFVALFGPTSPQWYGPLPGKGTILSHSVPCGPCDKKQCVNVGDDYMKCMKLITVEEVLNAAMQWLS